MNERAILVSVPPQSCQLISVGLMQFLLQKNKPKLTTPFKCFIYKTKSKYIKAVHRAYSYGCGKVIGEFVVDYIDETDSISVLSCGFGLATEDYNKMSYLTYLPSINNKAHKNVYGWHISNLKIYSKPKSLCEFFKICKDDCNASCVYCDGVEWQRADNGEIFYECKYGGYTRCFHPPLTWYYIDKWW